MKVKNILNKFLKIWISKSNSKLNPRSLLTICCLEYLKVKFKFSERGYNKIVKTHPKCLLSTFDVLGPSYI